MSYEGNTSNPMKHSFTWTGNNYSQRPSVNMTGAFVYSSSKQRIYNTFHTSWVRFQSRVSYASTQWVYSLQDVPANKSPNQLVGWDGYATDGGNNAGSTTWVSPIRWYPPYSYGIASNTKFIGANFTNSTGNTGNSYHMLEW